MLPMIAASLAVIAGLLGLPVAILLVEVLAALAALDKRAIALPANRSGSRRVAVIVPAHNESSGIVATLNDIKPQLNGDDRLIVVADNCSDDTASVASAAGAQVIARHDLAHIGKGFALDFGVQHLASDPPDFVVFVDADCRVQCDLIAQLVEVCEQRRRPVQAAFFMKMAANSPIDHSLAEFAFLLRNWVRPLGLWNLDGPVQLMGTGMIFPWEIISAALLASGHLVEDLKLGLDLAASGHAPYFLTTASVTSYFPVTIKGTESQRQRWVQGHLGVILTTAPRLLLRAVLGRNVDLLVLVLDLLIPPLSLLGLLVVAIFVMATVASRLGPFGVAEIIATADLLAFVAAIVMAWAKFAREVLPARRLLAIAPLALKKLRFYNRMLFRMLSGETAAQWIRTDREKLS
jgi:cellulose synthase/poly-beta-1,6-N-acetylglucosamine synthase-like glycosyltransferase